MVTVSSKGKAIRSRPLEDAAFESWTKFATFWAEPMSCAFGQSKMELPVAKSHSIRTVLAGTRGEGGGGEGGGGDGGGGEGGGGEGGREGGGGEGDALHTNSKAYSTDE